MKGFKIKIDITVIIRDRGPVGYFFSVTNSFYQRELDFKIKMVICVLPEQNSIGRSQYYTIFL